MNYKTTFKKSKFNVYRINDSFKCVASCVLNGIDPKDIELVKKLSKKFKDIKITKAGISFEVVAFSKCHEKDKFNDKKGRMLAEARCKKKVFDRAEKIMECIVSIKKQEFMKAEESLTKYGIMVETEFDHIMEIDEKRIYKVESIYRDDADNANTSDVKLVDIEYDQKYKDMIDTSGTCNIEDKVLERARVEVGDYIYVDIKNPNHIYQASQFALYRRKRRLEAEYKKKQN